MNQPVASLQAQRISVLPHPQVSINTKNDLRTRALKRNQGDPYPELDHINPLTNAAIDEKVKDVIDDITQMLSVGQVVSQKTAMALIAHSIERIHYNNQQQGIQ